MSPARMTASCIWAEMTARSSASKAVSLSTSDLVSLPGKTLDVGAAVAKLLLERLKPAIEVIDAMQHRVALSRERGDDQRHRSPEVGRHDGCAGKLFDAADFGTVPLQLDVGTKTRQFLDMHEAVLEDSLADDG